MMFCFFPFHWWLLTKDDCFYEFLKSLDSVEEFHQTQDSRFLIINDNYFWVLISLFVFTVIWRSNKVSEMRFEKLSNFKIKNWNWWKSFEIEKLNEIEKMPIKRFSIILWTYQHFLSNNCECSFEIHRSNCSEMKWSESDSWNRLLFETMPKHSLNGCFIFVKFWIQKNSFLSKIFLRTGEEDYFQFIWASREHFQFLIFQRSQKWTSFADYVFKLRIDLIFSWRRAMRLSPKKSVVEVNSSSVIHWKWTNCFSLFWKTENEILLQMASLPSLHAQYLRHKMKYLDSNRQRDPILRIERDESRSARRCDEPALWTGGGTKGGKGSATAVRGEGRPQPSATQSHRFAQLNVIDVIKQTPTPTPTPTAADPFERSAVRRAGGRRRRAKRSQQRQRQRRHYCPPNAIAVPTGTGPWKISG
jgi:hypothetical protein